MLNPIYNRTVIPTPEYCHAVKGIQVILAALASYPIAELFLAYISQ